MHSFNMKAHFVNFISVKKCTVWIYLVYGIKNTLSMVFPDKGFSCNFAAVKTKKQSQ